MMSSSYDELTHRASDVAIRVDNLTVVRGKRGAIDDVSLQVRRGSITGLLGPSGCGKTTLMRAVVGTQIITNG
ncbi:MAG: ATP-binding cassette domain-containing protein, partial [Actinobacteria bacterium]|nr:ATP-binding cassette domain-containing protein [Actinomycetota bacterium]